VLLARKANQDRHIGETERFIERFRAKATKARQAQSRIKALEKIERVQVEPDRRRAMRLEIPTPTRSGERVLSLTDLTKHYGEQLVYSGIDFAVGRGEKVALVGPNGAGKSTLLRIAAGTLDFDAGDRTLGHNVQLSLFAQHQLEALDPEATVLEELTREALTHEIPRLRGHLGAFLFTGDDVEKQISILSGGEKARVALAKLLLRPGNFLILDEPTNHLDIEACEVLEAAFQAYEGTILFVSHDRTLINALASRVVEVEHGQLENHLGNYDAYLERKARALLDPSTPTPVTSATPAQPASVPTPTTPARLSHKQARMRLREQRRTREKTARRIEKLETQIGEDEQRREALNWSLGDPAVYQDAERTRRLRSEQAELGVEIEALYLEWESLSEMLAALDDSDYSDNTNDTDDD
ncbi:MAG: ABC-F family ATP-binding cassette domain-containing protein, partial [Deltaproteobacteria bacterium]|nr:ABC-F family ATP-binding cassette domain-containing protein [Deltaproteobacteria bacterium]